jgi:hypothetical protein
MPSVFIAASVSGALVPERPGFYSLHQQIL